MVYKGKCHSNGWFGVPLFHETSNSSEIRVEECHFAHLTDSSRHVVCNHFVLPGEIGCALGIFLSPTSGKMSDTFWNERLAGPWQKMRLTTLRSQCPNWHGQLRTYGILCVSQLWSCHSLKCLIGETFLSLCAWVCAESLKLFWMWLAHVIERSYRGFTVAYRPVRLLAAVKFMPAWIEWESNQQQVYTEICSHTLANTWGFP